MNTTINARFSTFALPLIRSTGDSLQLVIYTGLAMSVYVSFFALYPTFERRSNIRALHYSKWPSTCAFVVGIWSLRRLLCGHCRHHKHIALHLCRSASTLCFLTATDNFQMADVWFAPSYLGIVLFLFGITSTYLAYLGSLFASSQLAAFAFVAG